MSVCVCVSMCCTKCVARLMVLFHLASVFSTSSERAPDFQPRILPHTFDPPAGDSQVSQALSGFYLMDLR